MKSAKVTKRASEKVEDARESKTQSAKKSLAKQIKGTARYAPKN
jgi:hypothetical protein